MCDPESGQCTLEHAGALNTRVASQHVLYARESECDNMLLTSSRAVACGVAYCIFTLLASTPHARAPTAA